MSSPLLYFFAVVRFLQASCPSRQAPKLSLRPVDAVPTQFDSQGVVAWSVAGYPVAEHWRATAAIATLTLRGRPSVLRKAPPAMIFARRWRHGAEREQEQLLVRLWTLNNMTADSYHKASALSVDARAELKPSLKYLSEPEVDRTIERTVCEAAYSQQLVRNLRRQIRHSHREP